MLELNLEAFGDRPLALDDGKGQLRAESLERCGDAFRTHIPARSLILLLAENSVGCLAGYLSCIHQRIVPLMVGVSTDKGFLEGLRERYRPAFVWLPETSAGEMKGQPLFAAMGYCLKRLPAESPPLHDELSLLLPTSGSTGSPKLVRHTYANLSSSARNVAALFELGPEERPVAALPMYFTMGLSVVASHLYAGATVLLSRATLTEAGFWAFLKEERATSFTGVPYSYELLHRLRFTRMDLPHLRVLSQGGGKLRPELFSAFAQYAHESGRRFFATYGQTEGTARMGYLPPAEAIARIGSIGRAIPGGRFSLEDDEGREIADPTGRGELVYRGPNVTMGYAFSAEDLAKGDEWGGILRTGDIAERDADGFHYIVGRKNRFLKLYGLRISLDEIEHMVKRAFPTECVAGGDDTQLRILLDQPDLAAAVKAHVVEKTGLFHGAVTVSAVEAFKRNEAGKLILPQGV